MLTLFRSMPNDILCPEIRMRTGPMAIREFPTIGSSKTSSLQSTAGHLTRLKMTYEEFQTWTDEDIHAEWIAGEAIVHMPPTLEHQRLVEFLERLLALFVQFLYVGTVKIAPFEMRLGDNSFEPDIMVIKPENL